MSDVLIPGRGPQPEVISVRVTNTGKKPIVVDGHSFLMKNKSNRMPLDSYDAFHNRRLESGEYISVTLSNALVLNLLESVGQLYGFFVVDSYGKKWWLSDKEISEIIGSLMKLKQSQESK